MAEERRYQIKIQDDLVEVARDIYIAYYSIERHTRTLDEKDQRNGKVLYSDLDTEETTGEDMLPDLNAEKVEDRAVTEILLKSLRQALSRLSTEEIALIQALYFEEMTEREYAQRIGISQMGVNKRRHRILDKLRVIMKIK